MGSQGAACGLQVPPGEREPDFDFLLLLEPLREEFLDECREPDEFEFDFEDLECDFDLLFDLSFGLFDLFLRPRDLPRGVWDP